MMMMMMMVVVVTIVSGAHDDAGDAVGREPRRRRAVRAVPRRARLPRAHGALLFMIRIRVWTRLRITVARCDVMRRAAFFLIRA